MGLERKSPQEILVSVAGFFQNNFEYSLVQEKTGGSRTPLGDFLVRTRSGHCEYFATAAVLVLRAAGIPARYATGYAVYEFSKLEDLFVVRKRHAHAWVLIYKDGRWHDFDTTPSDWHSIDRKNSSMFRPVYDFMSFLSFMISKWRWSERKESVIGYAVWLLVPLFILLAWRLFSRKRILRQNKGKEKSQPAEASPGAGSEFYLIEKRLNELGYERYPWEPLASWIERMERNDPSPPFSFSALRSILHVHYRYRFDPMGISQDEKAAFTLQVQKWLVQAA